MRELRNYNFISVYIKYLIWRLRDCIINVQYANEVEIYFKAKIEMIHSSTFREKKLLYRIISLTESIHVQSFNEITCLSL